MYISLKIAANGSNFKEGYVHCITKANSHEKSEETIFASSSYQMTIVLSDKKGNSGKEIAKFNLLNIKNCANFICQDYKRDKLKKWKKIKSRDETDSVTYRTGITEYAIKSIMNLKDFFRIDGQKKFFETMTNLLEQCPASIKNDSIKSSHSTRPLTRKKSSFFQDGSEKNPMNSKVDITLNEAEGTSWRSVTEGSVMS